LIVVASSLSALLASLLVMFPRLARVAVLLVVNVVVATAALADAVHLRVFGNAIALAVTPLYVRTCRRVPVLRPLQRVSVAAMLLLVGIASVVPMAKTVRRDATIYRAVRDRFSPEPAPEAMPRLARERAPFMAFLLSSSNHHPFALPAAHRTLKLGSLEGTELGDYLHSVHYFDEAFGQFVDRLPATRLLDESVVVVYGDHKGYLADERQLATLLGLSSSRPEDLWLERKRVPLVVRLPRAAHAGERMQAAGHIDVAPTVLSLANDGVMLGRDLTKPGDSLIVFRDGSFADGRHHLIRLGLRSSCFESKTGGVVRCDALEPKLARSLDELQTSDFIIQGNMIPSLLGTQREAL
jgi:Sulfatase